MACGESLGRDVKTRKMTRMQGVRMLHDFSLLNGVTVEIECCNVAMGMMHNEFLEGSSQEMQLWRKDATNGGRVIRVVVQARFRRPWRSSAVILAGLNYTVLLRATAGCQKKGEHLEIKTCSHMRYLRKVPGAIAGAIGHVVFLVVHSDQPRHRIEEHAGIEYYGHLRNTRHLLGKSNVAPVCATLESERNRSFAVMSWERPFRPWRTKGEY